jgi:hypothetical protein
MITCEQRTRRDFSQNQQETIVVYQRCPVSPLLGGGGIAEVIVVLRYVVRVFQVLKVLFSQIGAGAQESREKE